MEISRTIVEQGCATSEPSKLAGPSATLCHVAGKVAARARPRRWQPHAISERSDAHRGRRDQVRPDKREDDEDNRDRNHSRAPQQSSTAELAQNLALGGSWT
jgi:hypothetical protein